MAAPKLGARVAQDLHLDAETIRAGATLVGDWNPLHHDAEYAARSRFGGLIASGAHTSAVLCGFASKTFGDQPADGKGAVGVDFSVQFVAPARVDREFLMEWTVVALEPRRSGTLGRLEGRIVDKQDNIPVITARLSVLYFN